MPTPNLRKLKELVGLLPRPIRVTVETRMLWFYFDIKEWTGSVVIDDIGSPFASAAAACREAETALAAIVAEAPRVGAETAIRVRDGQGAEIHCVTLKCTTGSFARLEEVFLGC